MRALFFFIGMLLYTQVSLGVDLEELEGLSKKKSPSLAISKIRQILSDKSIDLKTRNAVIKISHKIFDTFYTEKGLNYYEIGRHLAISDPNEAAKALGKAFEQEPFNGKVFLLAARLQLAKGQCGFSEDQKKLFEIYPESEELKILLAQSLACNENYEELAKWLENAAETIEPLKKHVLVLWLRLLESKKDKEGMRVKIEDLRRIDSDFPELYYWESQVDPKMKDRNQELMKKYVQACANRSVVKSKEHLSEPTMCKQVNEIKEKNKNGS